MTDGGDSKRLSRIRRLTREELALWRHATVDVKSSRRMDASHSPAVETPPSPTNPGLPANSTEIAAKTIPTRPLAPLAPLEKRLKRRLSSGKAQVDGVIDLHGLTQAQAHRALNNFLWRSAEDGAKLVLVITGKGLPGVAEDHHMGERGVLRRHAPHWLRAPELRSIVLTVEEAARPHGGSGALYVRLRRRLPG